MNEMNEMNEMKVTVVGGPFRQSIDPVPQLVPTGKGNLATRIADELGKYFSNVERIGNFPGGKPCSFEGLREMMQQVETNVLIFMPHLPNILVDQSITKIRIKEGESGCIKFREAPKIVEGLKQIHPEMLLVPFKLADEQTSRGDIARWMLKLHAALAVYSFLGDSKTFFIADALGNDIKVSKENLPEALAREIYRVFHATRRRSSWKGKELPKIPYLDQLVGFSGKMEPVFANTIRNVLVDRWPGNFSFRCAQGFLSTRVNDKGFAITIRNVAKTGLTEKDFVFVRLDLKDNKPQFWEREDTKPSIDSPVHRIIYERLSWVNGIVHGHLHAQGNCVHGHMLDRWPCGSENEAYEILEVVSKTAQHLWVVNVEGHGFVALIGDKNPTEALDRLSELSFDRELGCCNVDDSER